MTTLKRMYYLAWKPGGRKHIVKGKGHVRITFCGLTIRHDSNEFHRFTWDYVRMKEWDRLITEATCQVCKRAYTESSSS